MALPYIFATQPTGNVPSSYLDTNFAFLQAMGVQGITATGAANAYIATPADALSGSYASYKNRGYIITFPAGNTGASTINFSGLGATNLYKISGGSGSAVLDSGDIISGVPYYVLCDGTNFLITLPASGALTNITSINGGQIAGVRNALINGGFDVWQRGTTFSPVAGTVTYTADRWFGFRSSVANWTISRYNSTSGSTNYGAKIQRTAATTDLQPVLFYQITESVDAINYAGKTVTVSYFATAGANFSSASSLLGVVCQTGTGTDQGSTSLVSGSWTGLASSLNATQAITTTQTRYSHTFTIPAGTKEFAIRFGYTPVGTAGADDSFSIENVQLEIGSVATSFEHLPYQQQLSLCQRYYAKTFDDSVTPAQNAGTTGSLELWGQVLNTTTAITWLFPVKMRTSAPTITTFSTNAASANWSTNGNIPTFQPGATGQQGISLRATTALTAGVNYSIHATASAEL